MAVYPTTLNLPPKHLEYIGQISIHYAFLEWRIKAIIYKLMKVGPKEGRLAVRDQRSDEQISLIENLLGLRKLSTSTNYKSLKKLLKRTDDCRNALVHGIWVIWPNVSWPALQAVKGEWRRDKGLTKPRKIDPEAIFLDYGDFEDEFRAIRAAILRVERLEIQIDRALSSSRKKQP